MAVVVVVAVAVVAAAVVAAAAAGSNKWIPPSASRCMMDRYKEQLGFTNDTDWSAVEPLVQKVMDARRDTMSARFAGGFVAAASMAVVAAAAVSLAATPDPDREALQRRLIPVPRPPR